MGWINTVVHSGLNVQYSLPFCTLATHCYPLQGEAAWPSLKAALNCTHKRKYLEGSLTTCPFSKTTVGGPVTSAVTRREPPAPMGQPSNLNLVGQRRSPSRLALRRSLHILSLSFSRLLLPTSGHINSSLWSAVVTSLSFLSSRSSAKNCLFDLLRIRRDPQIFVFELN